MKATSRQPNRTERARILNALTEIVISVAILSTMLAQLLPNDVSLLV